MWSTSAVTKRSSQFSDSEPRGTQGGSRALFSKADPLEMQAEEQKKIIEQKARDISAYQLAWYGSQNSGSIKDCFTALQIQAEMFTDSEDISRLFEQVIKSDNITDIVAPIKSLSTIFKGMLKFELQKHQSGFQVSVVYATSTSSKWGRCDFSHLKNGTHLPEDLKSVVQSYDAALTTKVIVGDFLVQPFSRGSVNANTSPVISRKLDSYEIQLSGLLILSKMIENVEEYLWYFPESPYQSLIDKDKSEAPDRADAFKSTKKFSPDSVFIPIRRQASKLTNSLIGKLQLFKAIQQYELTLTNADYKYVFEGEFPHFDSITTFFVDDISEELDVKTRMNDGTTVHTHISMKDIATASLALIATRHNKIPSATLPSRLLECEAVEPAGIGLHNWRSTCFMNAAFQMMATTLDKSVTWQQISSPSTVPCITVRTLLDKALESSPIDFESPTLKFQLGQHSFSVVTANLNRSEVITAIAAELSKIPINEISTHKLVYKSSSNDKYINLEVLKWLSFNNATYSLLSCINEDSNRKRIPVELQIGFLNTYYDLVKYLYRGSSLALLLPRANFGSLMCDLPTELKYAAIDQHDPQEFISDVFDLLGILTQDDRFLATSEYYHIVNKSSGKILSRHECSSPSASQFISIDNKTTSPNIDTILEKFLSEEELLYPETKTLDPIKALAARNKCLHLQNMTDEQLSTELQPPSEDDLKAALKQLTKAELEQRLQNIFEQYRVRKHLNLVSNSQHIPSRLMIQLKLFAFTNTGHTVKPTSNFTVADEETNGDLGQLCLIQLINNKGIVQVPVHLNGDKQPTLLEYRVDSVVCHTGTSVLLGHYTTLKFNSDGKATFYSDDVAISHTDFQKVQKKKSDITLEDFINQQQLSGYLYSLTRENEQDVPRETLPS